MDVREFVQTTINDPRFGEKNLEQKIQIKQTLLGELQRNDPLYQGLSYGDKVRFEKEFLTDLGYTPDKILGDDAESQAVRDILQDMQNVRQGGESSLDVFDGIFEGTRNFVTGKIVHGIVNLFTEGDTIDAMFGSQRDEAEKYREFVLGAYKPEGLRDYRWGKIAGNVMGFAGDAFATSGLYGSVGAPGLIGKAFGQTADDLLRISTAKFSTKAMAYLPKVLGQGSFEAAMYVAEEALADKIVGRLDNSADVQRFIEEIPSTLMKGFAFFAVGESIGSGLGKMFKSLGSVIDPKGGRVMTEARVMEQSMDTLVQMAEGTLKKDDGAIKAAMDTMASAGISKETQNEIYEGFLRASEFADVKSYESDPQKYRQMIFNTFYGMDTEVVGDAIKVKSIMGKKIEPQTFADLTELMSFVRKNSDEIQNNILDTIAKLHSDRVGKIKIDIISQKGIVSTPVDNESMLKTFRPDNKLVNESEVKNLADTLLEGEYKIVKVDDYFNVERNIADGIIYVPSTVKNAGQASRFADNFFAQVKALKGGNVEFQTRGLEDLLKRTKNVNYNEAFLTRNASTTLRVNPDKSVDVIGQNNEVLHRFKNLHEAGRSVHMNMYTPQDLDKTMKQRFGYTLQRDGEKVYLVDEKGKVKKAFESLEKLYDSATYRPPIPFEKRPVFFAVTPTSNVTTAKSFKNGKVSQLVEQLDAYAAKKNSVLERFTDSKGDITLDPNFNTFRVTFSESGLSKDFQSLEEAKKFLKKDMDKWDNLYEEALEKGYKITPTRAGYTIYSPNDGTTVAKDLKQVKSIIKKKSDLRNVKDVADDLAPSELEGPLKLMSEIQDKATKVYSDLNKRYAKKMSKPRNRISDYINKMVVPIRERLEGIGNHEAIRSFDKLATADKLFRNEYAQLKTEMNAIFHGRIKHTNQDLKRMGSLLEKEIPLTDVAALKSAAQDAGWELTDDMLTTMSAYRRLLDIAGHRFNIDPSTWVKDYSTRIRHRDPSDMDWLLQGDAMRIARGEGKITAEEEWFRYTRSEDYIAGIYEDNIEVLLDTYMRYGLRKQYFGATLDELDALIKSGKLDDESKKLLIAASNQVNGQMYSNERAREVLTKMQQNHSIAKAMLAGEGKYAELTPAERIDRARNVMETDYNQFTSSLVTSALMSGKMKMPIRNVSQVFTVLQMIAGPDYVNAAFKKAGDSKEGFRMLYKDLYNKGILKAREPRAQYGPWLQKKIANLNSFGMNHFYNSDDWTRVIAATSASERFRDAWTMVQRNQMDTDQFLRYCKVEFLSESDQGLFADLISKKKLEAAETFLQRRWAEMTMFEYDLLNKPEGLTYGIGKIFGQYSTYPLSYLQFVRRGLKAEKGAFAAKLFATTAVIGAFYNDILNIAGVNTNPIDTMTFTGGPMITSGAKVLTTWGRDINTGDKIKTTAQEASRILMPFYGIGSSTIKGFEAIKEAEYYDALSRFAGATPGKESQIESFMDLFE